MIYKTLAQVYVRVRDEEARAAGTVTLESERDGTESEAEAVRLAAAELDSGAFPGFVVFRGEVVPVERFQGLSAQIVSHWVEGEGA